MTDHLEIELKYEIDKSTYEKIKIFFAKSLSVPKHQINTFFDTQDKHLLASRWVVRLRQEDAKSFFTVKGEGRAVNALHTRTEFEEEISQALVKTLLSGFSLSECDAAPCKTLLEALGDLHLIPFMSFGNERIEIPWEDVVLELDRFIINQNTFYEVELETSVEKSKGLENDLLMVFSENGWRLAPSPMTKFARALALNHIQTNGNSIL